MAERVLILSADKWAMPDEKTGEIRNGVSVWYVNDYREDTADAFGFKPTKISADPSLLDELRGAKLPAVFEADYGSRPGAQNKPTLTIVKLTKIASVNVFNVKAPAAQPA
ncbi:hypothetical protein [Pseudomonas benzopyrenica]|uniref:hypothetical protein n=1 Tax=Pseudomonas benzopyrenica TaxID=2993566 RepID=UPI00227F5673|nr:hypothetical protein [Pseudomonas benzopyrenica]MDC7832355.1 hypothetical protein [Pseudomonas benzopyrenica]